MIGLGIANSLGVNLSGINPAAKSFVSATGISGPNEVKAINDLVNGLQADGIWSKMKAVYPFVTDNINLLGYTEDFSNVAGWGAANVTITSNTTTAPNGTNTSDTITDNTSGGSHVIFQNALPATTGLMTASVYLKNNTRRYAVVSICTGSSNQIRYSAVVDLQTGTITQNNSLNSPTNTASSIQDVGNGWYRVSVSLNCTTTAALSNYIVVALSNTNTPSTFASGTLDPSYVGDGSSIYVWGAQLELGSTATTYQPITTTQQAYIANQFKYNLVNPVDSDAAFRLVFNGGWTHSSTGATPNGTNGYADTKLTQTAAGMFSNSHFSFYSRTNSTTAIAQVEMGVGLTTGTTYSNLLMRLDTSTSYVGGTVGSRNALSTSANSTGHVIVNGLSASAKAFKNGTLIATDTTTQTGVLNTLPIYIGCQNANTIATNFSSRQTAFSSIGDGLTDTEAANLYTRVQAFQTALSRNV
jgi:hypothetical protein